MVSDALYYEKPAIVANKTALGDFVKAGSAVGVENPDDAREVAEKIGLALKKPEKFAPKVFLDSFDDTNKKTIRIYEKLLK